MFRDEDYLPPRDDGPKEVTAPDDVQALETALVSVCPRCSEVRIYTMSHCIMTIVHDHVVSGITCPGATLCSQEE